MQVSMHNNSPLEKYASPNPTPPPGKQMKTYKIAAIPGDGIGKEVIAAGLEVLNACSAGDGGFSLESQTFDWSTDYYKKHGVLMPENGREQLRNFDAIYFGAVGAPDVPDHITLWGLRLAICQPFDQYANVRPTRIFPGIESPLRGVTAKDLDWVIVRENSEGEYAGQGGRSHRGQPHEVGTEVAIYTRVGVTRIMKFAFELARSRPRKLLTVVTKSNAQRHGMVMWDEIAAEVAQEFLDVSWDKMLVDAMTARMTLKPGTLDTIVATNLHADILSDLAAALTGSLGIAPTANLNPEGKFPSMFEPIHGSAFDITGDGVANPIGAFWTGALLLDHLGEKKAAARLLSTIEAVVADKANHCPDLGGRATTRNVTDAVIAALKNPVSTPHPQELVSIRV
jgi:tartrate dehydrogenase/decarboxylase / D-malate dehydrogenase